MPSFKFAFMASMSYGKMPAEKVCKSLKKIGYSGVEWTRAHFDPRKKSLKELKELVEITHDNGLEVSEVVVQQDVVSLEEKVREDRISYALECIEACGEVGVKVANMFTGPAPWVPTSPRVGKDISMGAAWDMVIDAYDKFVVAAKKNKVYLAVEGVWGHLCHDYYTTRPLIDRYASEYLGVNFDPSHDVLVGNTDTGWLTRQWGKKDIKHVHLKDAVGRQVEGLFIFPLLGEGNVDWDGMKKALADMKYQGFMSVEFESWNYLRRILGGDMEKAAKLSWQNIQMLFGD